MICKLKLWPWQLQQPLKLIILNHCVNCDLMESYIFCVLVFSSWGPLVRFISCRCYFWKNDISFCLWWKGKNLFIQKDVYMNFEVDVLKASLVVYVETHLFESWLIFYNEDHNAEWTYLQHFRKCVREIFTLLVIEMILKFKASGN